MFHKCVLAIEELGSLWRHLPIFVPYLLKRMVKKHLILLGKNSCTFAKVSKMQSNSLRAIFSSLIHSASFHFISSNLSTHGPPKDVSKNSATTREELGLSKVSCSSLNHLRAALTHAFSSFDWCIWFLLIELYVFTSCCFVCQDRRGVNKRNIELEWVAGIRILLSP